MSHNQRRPPPARTRDQDMYRFGQNSSMEFGFRAQSNEDRSLKFPPPGPPNARSTHPPPRGGYGGRSSRGSNHNGRQRGQIGARGRGRWRPPSPAAQRAILRAQREPTPEQMPGMVKNDSRYRILDITKLESGDESDAPSVGAPLQNEDRVSGFTPAAANSGNISDSSSSSDDDHPRAKRARTTANPDTVTQVKPVWSNPDPYSLPVSDNTGPKRDVVKMIRRAKVENQEHANATAAAADFISFDMDDADGIDDTYAAYANNATDVIDIATNNHTSRTFDYTDFANDTASTEAAHEQPRPRTPPWRTTTEQSTTTMKRKRDDANIAFLTTTVSDNTPWMVHVTRIHHDPGLWLHDEIIAFYFHVKSSGTDKTVRDDLVMRVQHELGKHFTGVSVDAFGSFGTDLYLPTADMDLVLRSPGYRSAGFKVLSEKKHMRRTNRVIQTAGLGVQPNAILNARVPIIKYTDRLSGLKVDLSFENDTGLAAIPTVREWLDRYPGLGAVVFIIKQLLAMHDLNEVHTGGIGGFSVICMVAHRIHDLLRDRSRDHLHRHFDLILMDFLGFYGAEFDHRFHGLDMVNMTYIDKNHFVDAKGKSSLPSRLLIIDPNNPLNDVAGGGDKIHKVLDLFKQCRSNLMRELDLADGAFERRSLLNCMLGGDYSAFEAQKARNSRLVGEGRVFGSKGKPTVSAESQGALTPMVRTDVVLARPGDERGMWMRIATEERMKAPAVSGKGSKTQSASQKDTKKSSSQAAVEARPKRNLSAASAKMNRRLDVAVTGDLGGASAEARPVVEGSAKTVGKSEKSSRKASKKVKKKASQADPQMDQPKKSQQQNKKKKAKALKTKTKTKEQNKRTQEQKKKKAQQKRNKKRTQQPKTLPD